MDRNHAIAGLRRHEADPKQKGVKSLYLFQSTARGDSHPGQDVDVFYDYDIGTPGLPEVIGIEETALQMLACKADAMPGVGINRYSQPYAEADAVRVF